MNYNNKTLKSFRVLYKEVTDCGKWSSEKETFSNSYEQAIKIEKKSSGKIKIICVQPNCDIFKK